MGKRIVTAVGSDSISNYLIKKGYEIVADIPYQEGVLEFIKREFLDVLILSSKLSGEYDKYIFIEKIREIDKKIKIIVIIDEVEDNYKSFLYEKGIFNIFIDGKSSMEELLIVLDNTYKKAPKSDLISKNKIKVEDISKKDKNDYIGNLVPKFQRQQIIAFTGVSSSGKTTIATQFARSLSKKTNAKILLIDLDIVNGGLNRFMRIEKEPDNLEYILPKDKNSSLNYMIDAIDKRKLNANTFSKYVIKQKQFPNLDILTGNSSLYICKNILNLEYYLRILENAKAIYDYIIIDTSSNIFLDSMQFSILNSNKVFIITEGNYVSLERTCRLLLELFPVWGVMNKKIHMIINKYSKKSLDKTIINEMLKGYEIAGYISFSDKYEGLINLIDSALSKELENEYNPILEKIDVYENYKITSNDLKQKLLKLKSRICHKGYGRTEDEC